MSSSTHIYHLNSCGYSPLFFDIDITRCSSDSTDSGHSSDIVRHPAATPPVVAPAAATAVANQQQQPNPVNTLAFHVIVFDLLVLAVDMPTCVLLSAEATP